MNCVNDDLIEQGTLSVRKEACGFNCGEDVKIVETIQRLALDSDYLRMCRELLKARVRVKEAERKLKSAQEKISEFVQLSVQATDQLDQYRAEVDKLKTVLVQTPGPRRRTRPPAGERGYKKQRF
jgi:hypothetical protein